MERTNLPEEDWTLGSPIVLWQTHTLFQEELELEEVSLQTYHPDWELGDWLFLICVFSELTKIDLWATATTSQCLMKGARCSKETQAATTPLSAYIVEFQSVFAKEDFDILLEHCKWDYAIELIPGVEPKSSKVYLLSPLEQAKLDVFLEENLHTGQIWPFKSSIAVPVFCIKKKDSSLWLVQDYCALNAITVKNKYSFSLISELISQFCKARYFTKLDI